MFKKKWIAWIGILFVAGGVGAERQGQRYLPGPSPDIDEIQSQCVAEAPLPRERTDLGIGEEVRCWIDPNTWIDIDICLDAEGKRKEVGDTLGAVVWSVEGAGTVFPIVTDGSATTMTADLGGDDDTATVIATVRDSGTMGDDPPIQQKKVFKVFIPRGTAVIHAQDNPPVKKNGNHK